MFFLLQTTSASLQILSLAFHYKFLALKCKNSLRNLNNFSSGFLAIILAGFMAGKEVKLTGTLICQIKCNLSFSLANRRGLSLTSLPPFSLSFSLSLREVIHYCNLFAAENAKYLFNFEHSSIYLFAQSQFKQKSSRSPLVYPPPQPLPSAE